MGEGLPVDAVALRTEVKGKYRAVAVDPRGSYHDPFARLQAAARERVADTGKSLDGVVR